jgi:hypothetical protein
MRYDSSHAPQTAERTYSPWMLGADVDAKTLLRQPSRMRVATTLGTRWAVHRAADKTEQSSLTIDKVSA